MDWVASSNKKQRFQIAYIRFEEGDRFNTLCFRAHQGHSGDAVSLEATCKELTLDNMEEWPEVCVHGTYEMFLESIWRIGLSPKASLRDYKDAYRMPYWPGEANKERNELHFSAFPKDDRRQISGMRSDCEIGIYIDMERAIRDGCRFFETKNGVIVSRGVGENGEPDLNAQILPGELKALRSRHGPRHPTRLRQRRG